MGGKPRIGILLVALCLLIMLLSASGCAALSSEAASHPATTLVPTATPWPTSIPQPTVTPLPTAAKVNTAGWTPLTDPHWSGYVFPRGNVTGIRAQWHEPQVTGNRNTAEFVWIGIGGWNETDDNILQVGTFAYFPPSGDIHQGIWYETMPPPQAKYPLISVSPGDQIFASIQRVKANPQTWQLLVIDMTSGATFDKTVQIRSVESYADYVVEAPNKEMHNGPPYYPLPHFTSVTFTDMQVRIGTSWISANAFYGYRVTMTLNGTTLSTSGPMHGTSFTVTRA